MELTIEVSEITAQVICLPSSVLHRIRFGY